MKIRKATKNIEIGIVQGWVKGPQRHRQHNTECIRLPVRL